MPELAIGDKTMTAIRLRAVELANQAPPLTSVQIVQLRAIFGTSVGTAVGHV